MTTVHMVNFLFAVTLGGHTYTAPTICQGEHGLEPICTVGWPSDSRKRRPAVDVGCAGFSYRLLDGARGEIKPPKLKCLQGAGKTTVLITEP